MIAKDEMYFTCFIAVLTIHLYACFVFDEVVLGPRRFNSRDVKYDVVVRSLDWHSLALAPREARLRAVSSRDAQQPDRPGEHPANLFKHIT